MLKRIILATVLCTLLVAGAASAHGHKAKVKLEVSAYQPTTNGNGIFIGSVDSKKKSCADGVNVTLYLRKSGKDKKIGAKKSFAGKGEGYSFIIKSKKTKEGNYYATTKGTSKCMPAKSMAFKLKFA